MRVQCVARFSFLLPLLGIGPTVSFFHSQPFPVVLLDSVCVCVCVCVRERERERARACPFVLAFSASRAWLMKMK